MTHILIIEDDDDTRHLLEDILKHEGHTVLEARNGQEGVSQYRTCQTELVVTDLLMPEKEGLETIMDLRREFPNVNIVAMTGAALSDGMSLLGIAKKLGAVSTLQKPFEIHDFLNTVNAALES